MLPLQQAYEVQHSILQYSDGTFCLFCKIFNKVKNDYRSKTGLKDSETAGSQIAKLKRPELKTSINQL